MGGTWYIENIIIDSREKQRGTNAYNYYSDTYSVDINLLDYGDYLFNTSDKKQIIFEYKTCEDFIHSMQNQSLFNEISNQGIHYEYSYLVICGDWNTTLENLYYSVPNYRYKYKTMRALKIQLLKQIKGALHRIYSMYVPIIFADDEDIAFEEMLRISLKIADTKKYGGIIRPSKKSLKSNPTVFYLTKIKGIGNVKAENIANELDIYCLDDLCEKKPSDFLSVNRVNEQNVCDIWKNVHNEELDLTRL